MIERKRGRAIFGGTRIPVWHIVKYLNIGVGERQLLETFPSLDSKNLQEASEFYKNNKWEIDREIAENA